MEVREAVIKTIEVFRNNVQEEDDRIIEKLIESEIQESFVNRLVNFITTAFCMVMYESSDVNFQYSYFFFDGKGNVSEPQLLMDEPVFSEAYKIARERVSLNGADETYLNIASRDAGYEVIQQFIESGSNLKDVEFAPMGIYSPNYFYSTKKWWEIWK